MRITLGNSTLCSGDARSQDGANYAMGPSDLVVDVQPGVSVREFVGADRVQPEHVRCDRGTVSFGVVRTFATPAAALAWVRTDLPAQASEGPLKFDDETVFGPKSAVTNRRAAVVGCSVAVNYTIVG